MVNKICTLILTVSLLIGCTGDKQQKRWPSGDVYKPVERFQLAIKPKKYNSKNIAIQGYLQYNPARGGYILYTEKESYFSNDPYTAIYIKNIKKEEVYFGCHGKYVNIRGKFKVDKYRIMTVQVDSIQGIAKIPSVEGASIDWKKYNILDVFDCQTFDDGARPWMRHGSKN